MTITLTKEQLTFLDDLLEFRQEEYWEGSSSAFVTLAEHNQFIRLYNKVAGIRNQLHSAKEVKND